MSRKRRIFLVVPCFMPHDAVGNDILGMHRILTEAGYHVRVVAPDFHSSFEAFTEKPRLDSPYWSNPEDILIYHHAIGWSLGETLLQQTRNKVVIRYHNITPAKFYQAYSPNHYNVCRDGETSTARVARHPSAMFWGASRFNAECLASLGAPPERCRWLAPCHLIEELNGLPMDATTLGSYRDGCWNILFVGGLRPNKGHALALEAFAAYRHIYNQRTRIIFAGSYDPALASYLEHIQTLAQRLGIAPDVVFRHSVSIAELKALYYAAGVFLCVSEHEGFCVPLVEAMALRVPILAWGQTAIPETLGDVGVVRSEFDPVRFADSLEQLRRDPEERTETVKRGRLRYEQEYHPQALGRKLLKLVAELEDGPSRP